ncbi:ABC-type transport system substrate-binding protein [Actimicrobium sp. GrIS 1.19]|uniref:ABC transporter substrate-binding protein n=1 Tax=Actimicrobium sp. GrIS 1.19 TaxID=3071708 RepID=UPI002E06441E|nr:ABC-type transport system substrate-binding protein [Actimicrobium sp. GrIS 1.19]
MTAALHRLLLAALLVCTAPVNAADPSKTLHVLIPNGEAGIDPATAFEANTSALIETVFDSLLQYQYLARPLKLQPNLTTAMPDISADGLTVTVHLQPGILFNPDPAFKGKPRELVAADVVYSFKRLYDPTLRSPWLFLLDGKLVGDAALKKKFNVDTPIAGLQAPDRYTLVLRLNQPDKNLPFVLAMPALSMVAREVIEAYPHDAGSHPVGTGPFRIASWQRSNQIVLEASPSFRRVVFDESPGADPASRTIAAALKGKTLPLIGRIDIKVIEEHQTQMLGLLNGDFDYVQDSPPQLSDMILADGKLKPALQDAGATLTLFPLLQINYMWMNMQDPVIGGYTPEKIALRRAIDFGYDRAEDIRLLDKGLALPAQSPVPPNVLGYDAALRTNARYDPAMARALLDRFGYKDRDGDGFRELPDGSPLTLTMHSTANTKGRLRDELWHRSLTAIGLRVVFKSDKYSEIIKASRLGQVQMYEFGWVADYPDGENFLQLLYGPNIGVSNDARFDLPAYNRLFEQARKLPDSPERTRLYDDMAQLVAGYAPWVLRTNPLSVDVRHRWVRNYLRHPVTLTTWRYLDLDGAPRANAQ